MSLDSERQQSHSLSPIHPRKCCLRGFVPAKKITEAYRDARPEQRVACEGTLIVYLALRALIAYLSLKDDGHDDSVNGDGFAEDDTELGPDYLTKFLERIRGALTAAPRMLAPAM